MKKILCLFLCLMMLIPASVSLAASTEVKKIDLIVAPPTIGATVGQTAPSIEFRDPEYTSYLFDGQIKWTQSDYQTALSDTTVFEGGKTYYVAFKLVSCNI